MPGGQKIGSGVNKRTDLSPGIAASSVVELKKERMFLKKEECL
jgi:hypothetical protein